MTRSWHPSRRTVMLSGGAVFGAAHLPRSAHAAANRDPRLIVIILRGALDGLSAVGPIGDPDYVGLHGDLAIGSSGDRAGLPVDGFFALNPGLVNFARLYAAKQAAVIHAVSTPYRDRSHFDGQDVLESGFSKPGHTASGWLNRAVEALPRGERARIARGLAVGVVTPLILRGSAPVVGWAPTNLPQAGDDLATRLLDLYQHADPRLASAFAQAVEIEKVAAREAMGRAAGGGEAALIRQVATGAARLIAAPDGPRIASLAFDGWDTHANEGGPSGRLAQLLAGLDGGFAAFEQELGSVWKDTVIVAVTEFGRTARINGTVGTDHGTGTVAFLAGGAVNGGRIVADWPGLSPAALHENRDLRPTTDLWAVLKGVLADHLGLSPQVLAQKVFPDSAGVAPMKDLIGA